MKPARRVVAFALVSLLAFGGVVATAPAAGNVTAAPKIFAASTTATVAPNPRILLNSVKIATFTGRRMTFSGSIRGATFTGKDKISVRVYVRSGSTWKVAGSLIPSRTRVSSTQYDWRTTFVPKSRASYRVQAVLESTDGRYGRRFSAPKLFRAVSRKYVALTFDDGAWRTTTDSIRATLDRNKIKATFFMVGQHTSWYPAQAKRVARSGHEIGVHSMTHPMLASKSSAVIRRELGNCKTYLRKVTGRTATWYRPPGGSTSARVRAIGASLGMKEILWTCDTGDWRGPSSGTIRSRAVHGATSRAGAVILMHDGGGDRSHTAAAVPGIIHDLKSRGYDFVTMDEWAALK